MPSRMNLELESTPLPDMPPPHPMAGPASPRTVRWVELALLLAVALGGSLIQNIESVAGTAASHGYRGELGWLYGVIHETGALGLCAYILHKQGRSFRQIGLVMRWFDPFYGFAIMILGLVAMIAVQWALYFSGMLSTAVQASHASVIREMFGPNAVWGMVVFTVVNAFFEELIVRAYLITDLRFLTGSTLAAVLSSALFQGFYHLYQGWQAALAVTAGFVIFSLFYLWSRRVTPVVFAHMFWDLYMVAYYYIYWRHR